MSKTIEFLFSTIITFLISSLIGIILGFTGYVMSKERKMSDVIRIFRNPVVIAIIIFVIAAFPLDYLKGFGYASICLSEGFDYTLTTFGWGLQSACFGEIKNNLLLQISGGGLAALVASTVLIVCTLVKWYKPGIVASTTLVIGFLIEVLVHSVFVNWYMFNQYVMYLPFFVFSIIFGITYWKVPLKKDWKKSHWLIGNIIIVIIGSIASIIILYVNFEIPNMPNENDFPNWLTLVVEIAFGVIITLIVYEKTTVSNSFVKEKVEEIRKMSWKTKSEHDEKSKTAINQILNNFENIKKNIENLKKYLDNYNSNQDEINEEYGLTYYDYAEHEFRDIHNEIKSIRTTVELAENVLKFEDAKEIIGFCESLGKLEIQGGGPFEFEDMGHLNWMENIKMELNTRLKEIEKNEK